MTLEEISEILKKFSKEEDKIKNLLEKNELADKNLISNKSATKKVSQISLKEAVCRNKEVLKDLETVKGNLRSKAIFSPMEMQWEKICSDYRDCPSLSATTYRCHLPIFV